MVVGGFLVVISAIELSILASTQLVSGNAHQVAGFW